MVTQVADIGRRSVQPAVGQLERCRKADRGRQIRRARPQVLFVAAPVLEGLESQGRRLPPDEEGAAALGAIALVP